MPSKNALSALAELMKEATEASDGPINQADIVHGGTAIVLPDGMPMENAVAHLRRRIAYDGEEMAISEDIECFPSDGAVALQRVLKRRYGWSNVEKIPGFFGATPPMLLGVEVGPNQTVQVPWGRFTLVGIKGWLQTGTTKKASRVIFQLQAMVLRKHENEIKAIADEVREEVRTNSIYRGKTVKLSFSDEESMWTGSTRTPEVKFLDVSKAPELVYSEHVQNAIQTNLLTPLEHHSELKKFGLPFKRGVLLAGHYGTGKTLAASAAAHVANANGITFVYVENTADFAEAVTFARQYQPAAIFAEDIDRITGGDRTLGMDAILNIVDGIDAKTSDLMIVLTTNNVNAIHQGMLRPGRLDAVIEVEPPDANAVERLIHLYGFGLVADNADLTRVGEILAGEIPAVIREVVERAKLAALRLRSVGQNGKLILTEDALIDSAHTMRMQISLLNRRPEHTPSEMEKFGAAFGASVVPGLQLMANTLAHNGNMMQVREYNAPDGHVVAIRNLPVLPAGVLEALANHTTK